MMPAQNGWLTLGYRHKGHCSCCQQEGEHREIRVNFSGYPTPCVWTLVCDGCWAKSDTKFETTPLQLPPVQSRQVEFMLG
jgi:hypothetical protein